MPITFHTADVKFTLKQKSRLKAFIHHQIITTCPELVSGSSNRQIVNLGFIFCSDEYLRAINKKFLNHDYYTDIITFPLSDNEQVLEGEIYISIDRVRENSDKLKVISGKLKTKGGKQTQNLKLKTYNFNTELHRVMFHGILHLLGYKDKTKAQKAEMRKMEDKWLKKFEADNS